MKYEKKIKEDFKNLYDYVMVQRTDLNPGFMKRLRNGLVDLKKLMEKK